ncbi:MULTISPECIES: ABC transporter permease [Rhizobium/Agrobacterium group]|uniref:ABC transporter permease n=1 Tax=Agrobacterium cucumeris TaxID=2862866 RepID=A0ABY8RVS5_9HYPH|nr:MULTISPECIES: ABC transporter permease [Rhizobium/Agrobacterium group]MCZ7472701.1 ABC transporter permease [Rhizobium rhizogenes]MCZ7484152.1 ABC transporter permease [Rhizobium rhizogenes]WHO11646.1 ABC transporter permease [Agrobacterium cucumeris]
MNAISLSANADQSRELKTSLRAAQRRVQWRATFLILPLFLFMVVAFVMPLGMLLFTSVYSPEVRDGLPRTTIALSQWRGKELPDDATYQALVDDLTHVANKEVMTAVAALNLRKSGFRSLLLKTKNTTQLQSVAGTRDDLVAIDKRWGDVSYWQTISDMTGAFTSAQLLATVDLSYGDKGDIVAADEAVYGPLIARTVWIAFIVLSWCVLLGYPISWTIAQVPDRYKNLLLLLVLVPLWTSLLARTAAWLLLFQKDGKLNEVLVGLGIFDAAQQLLYTRGAVYVAMVHIMLPLMVLPIYAIMKTIGPEQVRAAKSLGASPSAAFFQVYLPQTLPGVTAGSVVVFVMSLGFYITPTLIGGGRDVMLSTVIAQLALKSADWPLASALALVMLIGVAAILMAFRIIFKTRSVFNA